MNSLQHDENLGDILIVDDNVSSLRVLQKLLSDEGYQVRSARDGATALMIAVTDPPDLILLDVMMPEVDGFAVCRQLKDYAETKDVPVIFVSGLDEVVDKVRGLEAGGVDYITKPYKIEEVQVRVRTHLTLYRLSRELKRRVKELSGISRIAQIVATTADLTETLTAVSEQISRLFAARLTLITVPDESKHELQILASYEQMSGSVATKIQTLPLLNTPVTREVLTSGETTIVKDFMSKAMAGPAQELALQHNLYTVLVIPLKLSGRVIGTISLGLDGQERQFNEEEIKLAETLGSDIAGAVENARLTEKARVAAVDAERQRLARELHDSVTQSLYSLTLLSSGWSSMAKQSTLEDPAGSFQQLGDLGQQALREMRLLIHQLRPPILEDVGLVQALQQRLDAVELRANVESRLLTRGDVEDLPHAVEDQLFFIGQEALNNSLRHAFASELKVRIENEQDYILLSVEDDGRGFDPKAETAGIGLRTMQERAESVQGNLTITSAPGQGTVVEVSAPIPDDEGQ